MLPPSFYEQFEDRLNLAVTDLNMQRDQIAAELGDIPGIDTLSVRYGDGLQFVTFNGRTTALSEAASIEEIRRALNLAKIDNLISARQPEEAPMTANPMDRLKEKLARAAGAPGRTMAKIESRVDALLAKEDHIDVKTDRAFAPHEQMLDSADQHLDTMDEALNLLSNGGPALND